jgi:hypothetical protein
MVEDEGCRNSNHSENPVTLRHHRRPHAVIAISAVLFGLTAPAGLLARARQTPAQLVTQAQVEAALGVGVRVEPRNNGYSYTLTEGVGGVTIDITPAEAVSMMANGKDLIAGLGDQAFFMSSSSRMAILLARKGTKAITLSVQFPLGASDEVTDVADTARELAALALEKL